MKTLKGDLLQFAEDGNFDVIIHGCNCFCQMGKGIALTIKNKFPEAYKADLETAKGEKNKLGTYSKADTGNFTIVNAYTQYHWAGKGRNADYDAIRNVMKLIKQNFSGKRIGYPLIGAGLAGGDWDVISTIISEELKGEEHTVVIYQP
jgi:O-acetyl-ADP-ribose deacetylase (regulator of RNase III)